jgi:hypothetical protein
LDSTGGDEEYQLWELKSRRHIHSGASPLILSSGREYASKASVSVDEVLDLRLENLLLQRRLSDAQFTTTTTTTSGGGGGEGMGSPVLKMATAPVKKRSHQAMTSADASSKPKVSFFKSDFLNKVHY